ncbi:carbohydrate sulfotransferase 14-like [Patiria miniata]|uniref:Carbohydrate sulfotransferase n=1 Tax=Patiria miniata TaxID=46514 RepID=A0A914A9I5_PATMI|nr:carbohydrate sulfotransferase 14-like [Patiria miniata]
MRQWCARPIAPVSILRVLIIVTGLSLIGVWYFFLSLRDAHWETLVLTITTNLLNQGYSHILIPNFVYAEAAVGFKDPDELQDHQLRISTSSQFFGQAKVNPTVNVDVYMEQELERRRKNLNRVCQRLRPTILPADKNYTDLYHRVLVSDKYKLLLSYIPKVSCTLWKNLLHLDTRGPNNQILIKRLGLLEADEIAWYLQHYKKAVFVREPITRLLSAWMSKLSGITRPDLQQIWEECFKREFVPLVRGNRDGSAASSAKWLNITFAELARYVVALGPNDTMDVFTDHWLPQSRVAHACHMQYDYIGYFENLAVEGPYLFKWLGAGNEPNFPGPQPSKASAAFEKYTQQLPVSLIRELFDLYRNDYEMFGYSINDTLKTITGSCTWLR